MGGRNKKGRGGGGGGGRGGGRGGFRGGKRQFHKKERQPQPSYDDIDKQNEKFEEYYKEQGIIPDEEEFDRFLNSLREQLPTTWRFTGSKGHAIMVRNSLLQMHIPHLQGQEHEGKPIEAPSAIPWYPDDLAWQLKAPKSVVRKSGPFKKLQAFLVSETVSGNISRQEAVSMIPPLLLDVEPHHTVLDMCAAPGSKTAQLIEALHAKEEQLVHEATAKLKDRTEPVTDPTELGMPTGLVIANDADYKRANMLIHQTKRLNSPSIIITNNDAQQYPALRLTPQQMEDGRVTQRYLRFDRVLADVPCSGDGTMRKNPNVWNSWTPGNANGLWGLQLRILIRGLQLLKVGGRLVYSTCSLNPIENESVVRAAIERCGGPDNVDLVDVSDRLPGLKRVNGLRNWKVQEKNGDWFENWEQVVEALGEDVETVAPLMFPPKEDDEKKVALERCLRVYPHLQDTGGFFVAVLEKKTQFKVYDEAGRAGTEKAKAAKAAAENVQNGHKGEEESPKEENTAEEKATNGDEDAMKVDSPDGQVAAGTKRPLEESTEPSAPASPTKRLKTEGDSSSVPPPPQQKQRPPKSNSERNRVPDAEHFVFLDPNEESLQDISKFFNLSPHFPKNDYCVRNAEGKVLRTIYYTSKLSHEILSQNQNRVIKFIHGGIKMFNKQEIKGVDTCTWRIQSDGLNVVEPWLGPERRVNLTDGDTLKYLLQEAFPKLENTGSMRERLEEVNVGSLVVTVNIQNATETKNGEQNLQEEQQEDGKASEAQSAVANLKKPVGLSEKMVLPLWKNPLSVNMMIPKDERKALLLRLFDVSADVIDSNEAERKANRLAQKAAMAETNETIDQDQGLEEEIVEVEQNDLD